MAAKHKEVEGSHLFYIVDVHIGLAIGEIGHDAAKRLL